MLITWGRLRDLKSIEESKTLVSLEDMKKLNAKPTILARLKELEVLFFSFLRS